MPYRAISYTWGDPRPTESITLDGCPFPVGQNAYSVLLHLRSETESQRLWIDAICINQTNYEERARQVQKMRYVFSTATSVVAWLGPSSDDSSLAFAHLKHLSEISLTAQVVFQKYLADSEKSAWSALGSLFDRKYWTRIWVVQELRCAKAITVHCGSDKLAWEKMLQVSRTLQEISAKAFGTHDRNLDALYKHCQGGPANMTRLDRENDGSGGILRLAKIVRRLGNLDATDPRDKSTPWWA
jgi:hypothetical protein